MRSEIWSRLFYAAPARSLIPSKRPDKQQYQAISDELEDSIDMVVKDNGSDSGSSATPQAVEAKAFSEAAHTDTKLFSRMQRRTTFDTESLDSYYKPIDTYEGRHRWDPNFEW